MSRCEVPEGGAERRVLAEERSRSAGNEEIASPQSGSQQLTWIFGVTYVP